MSVKSFFAAMTLKAKIIIICTAVAVTSAAAVAVGVAVTKEDAYRVLKVFEMTGTAVVERDGSGALDAYVGMNLESGDTLTVADDSTLRISMDSDKYVLLDGGTILELVATGSPSDSRTSIDLKKGTILNEITNPLSANSSYEVSTPKATMAVRGTSFTVSVNDDDIGGYIIREDTFNGTVEVTLLDTDGKPKNDTALVTADKGVTIRTEPDEESGNPAEIDGFSRFVFENEEGIISDLGAGEDPIRDIRYDMVSATIKRNALRSNDENLMILDEEVVTKLRETSTSAAQTEKTTTAVSEPAPIASVSETAPVQTSVPEISAITEENTQTAVPSATIENQYSSPETSDVSLSVTEADLVSETAPTSVNSDTETVSEAVTAETITETTAETTVETIAEELFESEPETVAASSETKTETSETVSNTTTRSEMTVATVTTPDLIHNGSSPSVTTGASAAEKSVFEVKFMCDETLVSSVSVEGGKPVSNIPSIPEKNGYTGKWICDGKEFTSVTAVTSDITVNAVYTINTYTVTLTAAANETYSNTVTADHGTLLSDILPEVPAKTGYTGVWKIGGTVDISSSVKVTSDLDIRAVYTVNTYTVTFTAEADENYSSTVTADHGTPLADILPEVPAKTGYTGVWKIGGTVNISGSITVTADLDIKAVYTINTYTITFKAEGSEDITRTADYNTTVTDIPAVPAKTGHNGKWKYNNADFTSYVVITGNITVEAEYTPIAYTVSFSAPGADDTSWSEPSRQIDYDSKIGTLPEVPAKTGHNGVWTVNGVEIDADYIIKGETNVVAKYTKKKFTVTFTAAADTPYSKEVTAEYGTAIAGIIPAVPGKTGYEGVWKINNADIPSNYVITGNTEVKAAYTPKAYAVNFSAEGADEAWTYPSQQMYYDSAIGTLPDVPEKTGHDGVWTVNGVEIDADYIIKGETNVVAKYTKKKFTVTFTAAADTPYSKEVTAEYGTAIAGIIPAVPDKTGYEGVWKINNADIPSDYVITGNTEVKAAYTPKTYAVNFSAQGADDPPNYPPTQMYYDSAIGTLPTVPEKTGHNGVWTVDGVEIDADYIIKGDTSVVAVYTPKIYTVKFLNADGSLYDTREAEYNTAVTDIPQIQKDGYIIKWVYNGSEFTSDIKITDNIEVTAVETEAVKLTFNFVTKDPEVYIIPKGTSLQDNGYELPEPDANKYFTGRWSAYITVDWSFDVDTSFDVIESAITYALVFYDTDGSTEKDTRLLAYYEYALDWTSYSGIDADSWLVYSEDGSSSRTLTSSDTVKTLVDEFGFDETSTIKIVAVINERTLTWYDESGTSHTSSVLKGESVRDKLNSLHTLLDGYFWAGSDKETAISEDMTFTETNTVAYAVLNKYTVNFFDEDGTTLLYTKTATHGSTISEFPAVPDKTGFSGKWKCNGAEVTAATVVTGEMKVTAEYTAKTAVTITFTTNGSDAYATETAYIGDEYVFPAFDQNAFVNVAGMLTGSFEGYEYNGTIYQAGDTCVISGSMTLTPTFGW